MSFKSDRYEAKLDIWVSNLDFCLQNTSGLWFLNESNMWAST